MDTLAIYFIVCVFICSKGIWCKSLSRKAEVQNELNNGDKIVGGVDATIQNYPYQAYLILNDGRGDYECGGSIVSEYYIVSAAHCLPRIQSILVRIGSTNKFDGGSTYNTTTFYSHPMYNSRTYDYDVAIIVVNEGMDLDGYNSRAISLVRPGNDPQEGVNMIISGWGNTAEGGSSPETLMVAQVPVVSREDCNNQTGGGVTTRMFCAGYEEGGVDTCQGDSGGPAVSSRTGRLTGITSHGFGCARPNSPGVYTRVGEMSIRAYILTMTGL